jgi:carboxylesterase
MDLKELKKGYTLQGTKDAAVFMIPGFGGSPVELYLAAQALNEEGYTVQVIQVKGNGFDKDEQRQTDDVVWYHSVEEQYLAAKALYPSLYVLGYSMGGALSLLLASHYPLTGLILFEPAVVVKPWFSNISYLLKKTKAKFLWKPLTLVDHNEQYMIGQDGFYYKSLADLLTLSKACRKVLTQVSCPFLVFYSRKDAMVAKSGIRKVMSKTASKDKHLHVVEKSSHLLPLDVDCEEVFQVCKEFLAHEETKRQQLR